MSQAVLLGEAAKGMSYEAVQDFALVQRFVDELSLFGFAGDSLCFVVGSMKVLALTVVLLFGRSCFSQTKPATAASPQQTRSTDQQTDATVQIQSDAPQLTPLVNLSQPDQYGMAFLSFEPDKEGLAFMVAPDGKIGTVPMSRLSDAVKAGYKPLTVADLLVILNGVSEEETNLLKRFKELSDDYIGLAARYNRLAAVSCSVNAVQVRQSANENEAMRLMRFQNF